MVTRRFYLSYAFIKATNKWSFSLLAPWFPLPATKQERHMADEELEKLLGDTEATPQTPPEEKKSDVKSDEVSQEQQKVNEELLARQKQLEDLDIAKKQALKDLSEIRKAKKLAKQGTSEYEEDLPRIDFEDPSAKAWQRHIKETVQPIESESERERAEIFDLSLQKFLVNKPALAKNSDKLKELMETYESLSSGKITGKNSEVVQVYLDKAYAAVNYQQVLSSNKSKRINQAVEDEIFSYPGISSGAGSYASSDEESIQPKLSRDELEILMKWKPVNMDAREYIKQYMEDRKKYK